MTMPDESARAVLEARARMLARPVDIGPSGEMVALVSFVVAGETYGVPAVNAFGIFRLANLSPLPGGSSMYAGVCGWRGILLPIVDLRRVLGLPVTALDDLAWVIALGIGAPHFGILAQKVSDVAHVPAEGIRMPPARATPMHGAIRGVTKEAVIVLDPNALVRIEPGEESHGLDGR